MTIHATLTMYNSGLDVDVKIITASKETKTAEVQPLNWQGRGVYWDNPPRWVVAQGDLLDIRMTCPECGIEFSPQGKCECGYDWRAPVSDEQDALETRDQLSELYRGG